MRKIVCILLAVLLALSLISANAAEYTDMDTVKKVQQALNDAGYDCGTPDGAAGKKTKAAITSYQTDKGLTVTGAIDDELLIALGLSEAEATEEAPAEATVAEVEYTFQGIPWGSSPEDVEAALIEKGLIAEGNFTLTIGRTSVYPNTDDFEEMVRGIMGITTYDGIGAYCEIKPLKTIGGYEPNRIDFYFLNGDADDELQLTMVSIDYVVPIKGVFDGLSDALVKAYGNDYLQMVNVHDPHYYIRTWEGADDTVISLTNPDGFADFAQLAYTKTSDFAKVQATLDAVDAPVAEDAGL